MVWLSPLGARTAETGKRAGFHVERHESIDMGGFQFYYAAPGSSLGTNGGTPGTPYLDPRLIPGTYAVEYRNTVGANLAVSEAVSLLDLA